MSRLNRLTCIIFSFFIFFNCSSDDENISNYITTIPMDPLIPTQLTPPINANSLDGHYNAAITITKNTCNSFLGTIYDKIDFVSFNTTSGVFIFDRIFSWDEIQINIDATGNFSSTVRSSTALINEKNYKITLRAEGKLAEGKLQIKTVETLYSGTNKTDLKKSCYVKIDVKGYRRYTLKTGKSKKIEGDYKTKIVQKITTCESPSIRFNNFVTLFIPQKNNLYDITMDWVTLLNFPIKNEGYINTTLTNNDGTYVLVGNITSEKISFDITINYAGELKCQESYSLYGTKRFEDADKNESTIDGVYGVWVTVEKNDCFSIVGTERYHLESIKISKNKTQFILFNKTHYLLSVKVFENVEIKSNGRFNSTYEREDVYAIRKNNFNGTITPTKIDGKLTVHITQLKNTCESVYKIEGTKLYKHS